MTRGVALIATVPTDGRLEEVGRALADYAEHVRAATGTLAFTPYRVLGDPGWIVVWEEYEDEAAFEAHLADPANTEFNTLLAELTGGASSSVARLVPLDVTSVPTET